MNEIKAIIFDLDGTLIDSMYVWRKIDIDFLAERGLKVPPDYEQAIKTMHFEDLVLRKPHKKLCRYGLIWH